MSTPLANESRTTVLPTHSTSLRADEILPKEISNSIAAAIAGLEFGSVEITIHNSRVVQIERHERIRFASPGEGKKGGP